LQIKAIGGVMDVHGVQGVNVLKFHFLQVTALPLDSTLPLDHTVEEKGYSSKKDLIKY